MEASFRGSLSKFCGNIYDICRRCLFNVLSFGPIPQHIAFIMDGNRRFARYRNLKPGSGHQVGFLALMSILQYCYELGVKYVTIYAFSIDNFKRQPEEVQLVMDLMLEKIEGLLKEGSIVKEFGIKVNFFGNLGLLPSPVKIATEKVMAATAGNSKAVLSICVAYTSRDEIVQAVQESCKDQLSKIWETRSVECDSEENIITLPDLERHMYTSGCPDPDILLRTSGEARLSNFLLWQTTFCILLAPNVLWPEISFRHLVWAILEYQQLQPYLNQKKKALLGNTLKLED
ncbi:dehydrodolichyl diphosphate synthase CPT3-like [Aristolochia californica]|uniref:dehydrodolichyl diphosphate synthase CPT3-like n=1 Tax=Aristolochia californica TaxID=171875 RepID=UPI0035DCE338